MEFHVGATLGHSLCRYLVDENGTRKMELAFGQRKSIQTERVILVPGPAHEIETVNNVYDLFIERKSSLNEIARTLNARGVPNVTARKWTAISVRELLANEKYVGTCVYNRTSKKLNNKWRRNPKELWVRKVGAFEAVGRERSSSLLNGSLGKIPLITLTRASRLSYRHLVSGKVPHKGPYRRFKKCSVHQHLSKAIWKLDQRLSSDWVRQCFGCRS
jgi:hypothetical protein